MTTQANKQAERIPVLINTCPKVGENYRYWGEEDTVFVKTVQGCRITDCDDKEFVDFRLGYGPIILGYRDSRRQQRYCDRFGYHFWVFDPSGCGSGQADKSVVPQYDKVRFAILNGSSVMGALRTARGYTGRNRVVIVEGGFHGLTDEMMWKSDVEGWDGSADTDPEIIPFGAGIPASTNNLVDFIPLNSVERLQSLFTEKGDDIAAVLLEPIMGNCGSFCD